MKIVKFLKTCKQILFYDPFNFFKYWVDYNDDYKKIKSSMSERKSVFKIKPDYPCLLDKAESSGYFGMYIYQDSWAFRHILDKRPQKLVDIASSTYFIAFCAQFTQVESIDIRELKTSIESIEYRRGDVTKMPFDDNTVEAISTLSVIEHIGLGRYGDTIDIDGMEKAAIELSRILMPGGMLLVAFPVGDDNLIRFNAHRICTPEYSMSLFDNLILEDEKYVLRDKVIIREEYEKIGRPYSYGCYRFTKKNNGIIV